MCWLMAVTGDSGGVINVSHCSDDVMAWTATLPPCLPPSHTTFTSPTHSLPVLKVLAHISQTCYKSCSFSLHTYQSVDSDTNAKVFSVLFVPRLSVCPLLSGNWEKMFRKRRSNLSVGRVRPSASLAQPVDEL